MLRLHIATCFLERIFICFQRRSADTAKVLAPSLPLSQRSHLSRTLGPASFEHHLLWSQQESQSQLKGMASGSRECPWLPPRSQNEEILIMWMCLLIFIAFISITQLRGKYIIYLHWLFIIPSSCWPVLLLCQGLGLLSHNCNFLIFPNLPTLYSSDADFKSIQCDDPPPL